MPNDAGAAVGVLNTLSASGPEWLVLGIIIFVLVWVLWLHAKERTDWRQSIEQQYTRMEDSARETRAVIAKLDDVIRNIGR